MPKKNDDYLFFTRHKCDKEILGDLEVWMYGSENTDDHPHCHVMNSDGSVEVEISIIDWTVINTYAGEFTAEMMEKFIEWVNQPHAILNQIKNKMHLFDSWEMSNYNNYLLDYVERHKIDIKDEDLKHKIENDKVRYEECLASSENEEDELKGYTVDILCLYLLSFLGKYGDYKVETRLLDEDGEYVRCNELNIYHEGFSDLHIEAYVSRTSESKKYTLNKLQSLLASVFGSSEQNAKKSVTFEQCDSSLGKRYINPDADFEVDEENKTFIIKGVVE